jgi:AraC-like DNA-binding protein
VLEGSFVYRTDTGRALMHPGSLVLGNHGRCFQCGHEHGTGDRCIGFHFTPELFAEIAMSSRYAFAAAALPAAQAIVPSMVVAESLARDAGPLAVEEAVLRVGHSVLRMLGGARASHGDGSSRDERRVSEVLRYVDEHAGEPLTLDELARVASMSKYHFLRVFRRAVGMSPYQYVLTLRMRRAAVRLSMSSDTVAAIAFDSGFSDLSTFNRRFQAVFGASPSTYRSSRGLV